MKRNIAFFLLMTVILLLLPGLVFSSSGRAEQRQPLTLGGRVLDEAGKALPDVSVMVFDLLENQTRGYAKTDASGSWVFEKAEANVPYRLRYYHPLYAFDIQTQDINSLTGDLRLEDIIAVKIPVFDGVKTPESWFRYEVVDVYYARIVEYTGGTEAVVVPESIDGYQVIAINSRVFSGQSQLKAIALPNGLRSLGSYVFNRCEELAQLQFPNELASIGHRLPGLHPIGSCGFARWDQRNLRQRVFRLRHPEPGQLSPWLGEGRFIHLRRKRPAYQDHGAGRRETPGFICLQRLHQFHQHPPAQHLDQH